MKDPQDICVADASVLIALSKGNVIDCLKGLFKKVYIPQAVQEECQDVKTAAAIRQSFFETRRVEKILPVGGLHKGELEAISLAADCIFRF